MARVPRPLHACLLAAVLTGCTSVGLHHDAARRQIDFGPPDTVALCLYVDDGITEDFARKLVDDAWRDEAPLYGLNVAVAKVQHWSRPAFQMDGIMDKLVQERLETPCDRILALIGRNVGDFVWGLLAMPEILGAVDDETLTHGYAVARYASVNQALMTPRSVTRHELYHLLGCDEHFDMTHCYRQIAELKQWKREHQSDFFPAFDAVRKRILVSREAVNARLLGAQAQASSSALSSR